MPKFHRLYPVGDAPDSSSIDVILVHGLGGDYQMTWQAEDGTLWPSHQDFVPQYIPEARVLSWSYNSTINGFFRVVRNNAKKLLSGLLDLREEQNLSARPLIFIGHSLGGVIIKQAIRFAFNDPAFESIARSILGVMFFSTPHYGEQHHWLDFVSDVLSCTGPPGNQGPTPEMLEDIGRNYEVLSNVTEEFKPLLRSDLGIVSFVEDDASEIRGSLRTIVDRNTGYLQDHEERNYSLSGNHISICKFPADEEGKSGFRTVGINLRWLATGSSRARRLTDIHCKVLSLLDPNKLREHYRKFKPSANTCQWIDEREEYKRWLDWDGHPDYTKLWVTGDKACGKTFLARHILGQVRRDKTTLVLQCFVDGTSTPTRVDCDAVLSSTARQLAQAHPDLIDTFLLRRYKTDRKTLGSLQDVWPEMVQYGVNVKGLRTIVLVDGFDNLEDKEQELFLQCFSKIEPKDKRNLRLLIVSNPGTIDLEDDPWKFRRYSITQRDVSQDIYSTVYQLLDIPVLDDQSRKTASKRIQERAEGVYLWAAVVTHDLKLSFFTIRDVEEHINGLPGRMAELYDNILGRIKVRLPKETARVRHILLWIAFRHEKLSTDELGIGLALAKYREDYPNTPVHESTFGSLYIIQPRMVRPTVIGLCGQLVRFCRDEVELVHSSLALYLTYTASRIKGLDERVEIPNHGQFHLPPQESHLLLGNLCMSYLAMAPFSDSGASFDPNCREQWESKVRERVRNFKLVRYAALSWTKHLRDAGRELLGAGPPTNTEADIHAQRLIETVDSHHAVCWTEVWWLVRCWPAFNYPEGSRTPGMEHILVHPPRPTHLFPHLNDQHTQSMEPPAIDPIVSAEDAPIEADEYDVPQPIGGTVTGLVSNGAGHIWAASGGTLHQQLPVVFNHHHHITANLYFTEPERTMPNISRSGKKSRHRRRCSIL